MRKHMLREGSMLSQAPETHMSGAKTGFSLGDARMHLVAQLKKQRGPRGASLGAQWRELLTAAAGVVP